MTAGVTVLTVWRGSYDPFVAPKITVLGVGAAVSLVLLAASRRARAVPRALLVAAAASAVAWVAATFTSPAWERAVVGSPGRGTGLVTMLAGLALVVAAGAGRRGDARLWWAVLGGVAGVQGLLVVIQYAGLDPFEWTRVSDLVGTQGNQDFVAATCAIGLVPAAVAMWRASLKWAVAACVVAGFAAAGIALTGTGQGWAAALAGGGAVVIAAGWSRASRAARRAVVAAACCALVGAVVYVATTDDPNIVERREGWRVALELAADEPVLGVGPTGFSLRYTATRSAEAAARAPFLVPDDPHSVPLNVAAATGLVGFVAFAALHLLTARRLWYAVRAAPPPALVLALLGAWTAWWVQALMSIDHPGLLVLGAVTTGMIWSATAARHAAATGRRRRLKVAGAAVALLAVTVPTVPNLVASQQFQRAESAGRRADRISHLHDAARWWPHDHRVHALLARLQLQAGRPRRAASAALDGARSAPGLPELAGLATVALEIAGDHDAAAEWRVRWLQADPNNPVVLAHVAAAVSAGEHVARALLEAASEPEPGTAEGWLAIGDAYAAIGDDDAAVAAYERATRAPAKTTGARQRLAGAPDGRALLATAPGR